MKPAQQPTIRHTEIADLTKVTGIDRSAFPEESYSYWMFRQFLEIAGHLFLVASEDAGRDPIGYVLGCLETDNRNTVWMLTLAVDEDHRRQGIASALISGFLEESRQESVQTCKLTVSPGNYSAIALYEKHGWQTTTMLADYFGPGENRLLMEYQIGP